ncbi:ExeM/NucH family extracellular endonuclease [Cellulomonas fimi]|uniref:ExeM/NucH family extracellular endonuclease n=1 Tax=Cellulomonas sp. RIT-PI-Y TaxID=3035297 RepID=UPI0021D9AA95
MRAAARNRRTGAALAALSALVVIPVGSAAAAVDITAANTATIADVQGTGDASPLAGQTVTTSGLVTASYPTGGFRGYVIQTPGTGGDQPRTASDAVFVYSPNTVASVGIGDYVRVTGAVSEYQGLTEITVNAASGVERLDATTAAPVTPVSTPWPADDASRETLESMLYLPTGDLTVTNTYSTNQYGEVGLATGTTPLIQPTEVAVPGSDQAAAVAADNAARGVTLDDGGSTNFLTAANQSQTPPYLSLTDPVRVGAPVAFDSPVIVDYRNSLWKLNPTTAGAADVRFGDTRTDAPDPVGGDLSVASFNVLNYFTTLGADTAGCVAYTDRAGDGVTVKEGCAPRGAWDADDLQRQQDKIVAAINTLDADVVGLMEIENSADDHAVSTLVDALNAATGEQTWAFVPRSAELPDPSTQDVITNALIYRIAAVETVGDARALGDQSGDGQAFGNAREPIGQVFAPVGGGEQLFVAVNHFKSKGSAGPWPGDADTGDGQSSSVESRVRQAEALRDWIPTVQGDAEAVALVGDFNSYTAEDPLQVLYTAGYTDAGSALAEGEYSYSFSGLSGSLDHVLLNQAALDRATGADIWNINSGESIALEYSRYNYHGSLFYAPDAYRSSDHDPVIVGLSAGDAEPTGPVDLTLLNINDFHGRIDANTVAFAGTVEAERAAAENAVFLSAGDNIGASLFASSSAEDQPTIDVLNALDLAASAVGNHEFDRGYADLVDRVIADGTNAEFPYLGANVYAKGTQDPALDEYALVETGGITVGVIGAVTQETPTLVTPGGIADLDFGDPVEAVNRVAAQLTDGDPANGEADVIVAEYHEGAGAGTPDGATLEEEIAAGGAFADIVTATDPAVDVIFTGHTHKQYAWYGPAEGSAGESTRPIVQTGSYGENIGKVSLTYDPATGAVSALAGSNVARLAPAAGQTQDAFDDQLAATYPRVAEVQQIVDAALAAADEIGRQPVGSVTADITTAFAGGSYGADGYVGPDPATPTAGRDDRSKESTLGNLVADALLDSLSDADRGGAQIGVVNPGGLRSELLYAPDGTITYAEANAVLPFVNNLWTTTLTGAQVETMLEQQWQTNADGTVPSRPYLQLGLSDNVSYTYDSDATAGERITSVTVDGEPLDAAAEYRVGTFSFLAQGGDNFRVFTEGTGTTDSGLVDREAWIAYLQANPGLSPDFAERAVEVPTLPETAAGEQLAFDVAGLNLTSLGAPENTALDVQLDGTSIGSATLAAGAGSVSVTVPAGTTAGAHTVSLVAAPSGTTATVPLTVSEPAGPALLESSTHLITTRSSQPQGALLPAVLISTVRVEGQWFPSGTVEFRDGDTVIARSRVVLGIALTTVPRSTSVGTHAFTATFVPADPGTVAGSTSNPVSIRIR